MFLQTLAQTDMFFQPKDILQCRDFSVSRWCDNSGPQWAEGRGSYETSYCPQQRPHLQSYPFILNKGKGLTFTVDIRFSVCTARNGKSLGSNTIQVNFFNIRNHRIHNMLVKESWSSNLHKVKKHAILYHLQCTYLEESFPLGKSIINDFFSNFKIKR